MAELRWLLLLIGIGIIAAVYLYTRFKPDFSRGKRKDQIRREPGFSDLSDDRMALTPDLSPTVSSEPIEVIDEPVEFPDSPQSRLVVAIRLMAKNREGFEAEKLILLLRELGLRHGQFGIFHHMDDSENPVSVFSIASLVEPGSFDLTKVKTEKYPGVSIFMTLPGPVSGIDAFEEMLKVARELARKLDGNLLDEQGGPLSIQRERYMREEVIQFEHLEAG